MPTKETAQLKAETFLPIRPLHFLTILILSSLLPILLGHQAQAQSVQKVKGTAILIDCGTLKMQTGEEYFSVNESGKKTGLIVISAVKAGRAVGKLTKGVATPGESLSVRSAKPQGSAKSSGEADASENEDYHRKANAKNFYGFLLGYSMDSLSFLAANNQTTPSTENVSLTGSSFKLKGFIDHMLSKKITARFTSGYDGFNGTYSAHNNSINNNNSGTSSVSTTFITLEGEAMWNLYRKSLTTFYLTAGYQFDYVASLSTNLYSLQLGTSYLNSIFAGFGSNIKMSATSFLPVYFHYNYFLAGTGVTQSALNFGLGWGWAWK